MRVATHSVHVEKVEQAHLAEGKFEPPAGDRRLQVKRVGVLLDAVWAEGHRVVDKGAREIDRPAYGRIGGIGVDEGCDPKSITQTPAAGLIEIGNQLGKPQQTHAGVKGYGTGSNRLAVGTETVGSGIG